MNKEYVLNLDSLTDLNNFVIDISSNIPCDVDAKYGRQIVDAKILSWISHDFYSSCNGSN